jgi:hypothetical protein
MDVTFLTTAAGDGVCPPLSEEVMRAWVCRAGEITGIPYGGLAAYERRFGFGSRSGVKTRHHGIGHKGGTVMTRIPKTFLRNEDSEFCRHDWRLVVSN